MFAIATRTYTPHKGWGEWSVDSVYGLRYKTKKEAQIALKEEMEFDSETTDYKIVKIK